MRVDELALEDFRNYERAHLALAPGLNLVIGRNAQGKTNLLESIHCLSGLGSPRSSDAALVRKGSERALLHARVSRGTRTVRVDLEIRPGRGARALVNKTPVAGVRRLAETVTTVFFGPDELSLIKGSPEGRRRFLDDLVVKLRPAREGLRREWERVLRQRNALLRSMPRHGGGARAAGPTLEVWDEALCRAGAALAAARLEALGRLGPPADRRYGSVAGGGRLLLTYESEWVPGAGDLSLDELGSAGEDRLRGALEAALEASRAKEIERGVSLVGPQRDDVVVGVGEDGRLDARAFASQGDQRTAALALKLAEYDLLCDALGEAPVVLLDDVLSELDPARRAWLVGAVEELGQVLVSSAEAGAA
ncbi:MAG TPA: DNA replication/repair protein RecF, partial [Actinomycetota bacterium]|nr:DNA replication/repair protein RecF [Actinomycetota bacterium]